MYRVWYAVGKVEQSRSKTNATFPLPDVRGCLRYAFTEVGETEDAFLRMERATDKRNNVKGGTIEDARREWGQVGFMLASAAIQMGDISGNYSFDSFVPSIYITSGIIGNMLQAHINVVDVVLALKSWVDFCDKQGWEPKGLIDETCKAFEDKHIPQNHPV